MAKRQAVLSYVLLAASLGALVARSQSETSTMLIISSVLMFACCWSSAAHLLGVRRSWQFVVMAVGLGWFAEQMGATQGWFFGHYTYTDVLGPRLGSVPIVIPLMWFALTYAGYVISNLIVWQSPVDEASGWLNAAALSLLAAMIVTAYDLGADPYLVYTLKAWVMVKTDGAWFGETVQGFVGWVFVSFVIISGFRLLARRAAPPRAIAFGRRHALVPLGIYAGSMVFQVFMGTPIETRSVAVFAMGIPLLGALAGFQRWRALPVEDQGKTGSENNG
jgi:putative membrane protein